ncbi:MAG: hypothetical protein HY394_02025 [Candidatus Diapherotrites archaeon]|nr:hypothetical protein [Candidatus Diapherotrites archaeon]
MMSQASIALTFLAGFAATATITPFLIKRLSSRGFTGKDLNKIGKPEVPEMGGIAVIAGFFIAVMAALSVSTYVAPANLDLTALFAGITTIMLVGLIGIVDDLVGWKKGIEQWQHALLPIIAALPLMAVNIHNPPINLPVIGLFPSEIILPVFGAVSFGLFYSLVLVPIGVTGASNATNMLAGLNGLEAGLGVLIILPLGMIAFFTGRLEAAIIAFALLGALLAFLRFNWHPARIFGGDSLTLAVGASIAAVSIIGDMEKVGILLMALYFMELAIKARHRFRSECFGMPQKDGTLRADPNGGSITQFVMRRGRFSEKQVVTIILAMQAIVSLAVTLIVSQKLL